MKFFINCFFLVSFCLAACTKERSPLPDLPAREIPTAKVPADLFPWIYNYTGIYHCIDSGHQEDVNQSHSGFYFVDTYDILISKLTEDSVLIEKVPPILPSAWNSLWSMQLKTDLSFTMNKHSQSATDSVSGNFLDISSLKLFHRNANASGVSIYGNLTGHK